MNKQPQGILHPIPYSQLNRINEMMMSGQMPKDTWTQYQGAIMSEWETDFGSEIDLYVSDVLKSRN